MKTILRIDITVKDICEGFIYNELEGKGLFGLSGKLTIQPEYQRNYIYADGKRDVVRPLSRFELTSRVMQSMGPSIGSNQKNESLSSEVKNRKI